MEHKSRQPVIAGVDEVGRGCIVGPVVAAIVILGDGAQWEGLADSKKLTPLRRLQLSERIKQDAVAWAIGRAEPSEIDRINIHHASLLAMRRAFDALTVRPDKVLVDGKFCPELPCPSEPIIGGDAKVPEISAASILAKVCRDGEMQILDAIYPGYDFSGHKGYPTVEHKARLAQLGLTPLHRRSYAPVRALATRELPITPGAA